MKNTALTWEVIENGYTRVLRLVSYPSGLIVGGVEGRPYEDGGNSPWEAYADGQQGKKYLGRFVKESMARKAVEADQSGEEDKKIPSEISTTSSTQCVDEVEPCRVWRHKT